MVNIELYETVRDAVSGSQTAWDELVERFSGLVWGIARAHGLNHTDAADVSQTVWLRLAEHIGRLRDPERVGGWISVTARNEAQRVSRRRNFQIPVSHDRFAHVPEMDPRSPDQDLIAAEESTALWEAFERLPIPCRVLLRMLMSDPAPSYAIVSETLSMPIGSIGPRRSRCLSHLRDEVEEGAADVIDILHRSEGGAK